MKNKLLNISCICIILVPLISGCAFKDIDKRIFVQAIGIDRTDSEKNPYKVTLKLAVPTGSIKEAKGDQYTYLSKEGVSLAESIRFLKTEVDKELDFGHARVIVLGEGLLEDDFKNIMDIFFRRRDIQMVSWVAVGRPSAESVLKTHPKSEMAASHALPNTFSNTGAESPYIVSTFLFDVRRRLEERGIDPVIPVIHSNKKKTHFTVDHAVIFQSKTNFIHLTPEQTKLLSIISGTTDKVDITIKQKGLFFAMAVDTIKVKYKIHTPKNKPPVLKMNITFAGIVESSGTHLDPAKLDEYGKMVSAKTERDVKKLLAFFQEHDVDPLGFGVRYKATRLHTRDTYAEWKRLYPDLEFDVSVETKLMSTGTIE